MKSTRCPIEHPSTLNKSKNEHLTADYYESRTMQRWNMPWTDRSMRPSCLATNLYWCSEIGLKMREIIDLIFLNVIVFREKIWEDEDQLNFMIEIVKLIEKEKFAASFFIDSTKNSSTWNLLTSVNLNLKFFSWF